MKTKGGMPVAKGNINAQSIEVELRTDGYSFRCC